MKKIWRCTVCGYLHEGDAPPEFCPVCHADASKFVLVIEAGQEAPSAPGLLREMRESLIPHLICAHFPSALIPVILLFLGLYVLIGKDSFETTGYYLLVVAVLSLAPTIAAGLHDWRTVFGGKRASIFRKKIALASFLLALGMSALLWRWLNPRLLLEGGWSVWVFLLLIAGMLACVTLLGHFGGILTASRFELQRRHQK